MHHNFLANIEDNLFLTFYILWLNILGRKPLFLKKIIKFDIRHNKKSWTVCILMIKLIEILVHINFDVWELILF